MSRLSAAAEEIWLDPDPRGANGVLRVSIPLTAGRLPRCEAFWMRLGSMSAPLGYLRLTRIATIKGRSVFEATGLRLVSEMPPGEEGAEILLSPPPQVADALRS